MLDKGLRKCFSQCLQILCCKKPKTRIDRHLTNQTSTALLHGVIYREEYDFDYKRVMSFNNYEYFDHDCDQLWYNIIPLKVKQY